MKSEYWEVGTAVVEITPPSGIDLAGYVAREQGAIGVHDPLFAKACAFHDGRRRALLITCDLLGLDSQDVAAIRQEIEKRVQIPADHIMITTTHTHSGPATLFTNGIGERDPQWMGHLRELIVSAGVKATATLQPAAIRMASGKTDIGINRRGRIPPGSIEPLPNPNGPVDREVTLIRVDSLASHQPGAVLFACACHPAVLGAGNRRISADYPGAAMKYVEDRLGGNTVAMFMNGGAGNINPVERESFDVVAKLGKTLGREVVRLVTIAEEEIVPFLKVAVTDVALPFARIPSASEIERFLQMYKSAGNAAASGSVEEKIARACLIWAQRLQRKFRAGRIPAELTIQMQRIALGRLSILALPVETFAETVLEIRQKSSHPVIVASYGNGVVGYLPSRGEIEKGGYEVMEAHKYYDLPAHFSAQAERNVIDHALRLLEAAI